MRIKNILVSYRVRTPTGLTPLAIPVFQVAEMCVIDDDAPLSEESPWVDKRVFEKFYLGASRLSMRRMAARSMKAGRARLPASRNSHGMAEDQLAALARGQA